MSLLILIFLLLNFFPFSSSSDEISKKQFIMQLVANHKKIFYAKSRVNDFTCFAKPIIYSNAMTSYWPGHFKDKILSPFASSGIPILRILDLECSDTKKIIKQANAEGVWSAPNGWLLLGKQLEDAREAFPYIHLNTQVLIATTSPSGGILLHEIYNKNFDQDLVVLSKGEWFLDKPFNWDLIRFNKRFNLSGVKIIGTAIFSDSQSFANSHILKDFKTDSLSKICLNIFEYATEYLQATSKIVTTDTSDNMYPNGSWGGQIGLLLSKKAHVATTPFNINLVGFKYIDFLEASFNTRSMFIFRSPSLSYVKNVYILPFSTGVWLSCFIFVCLASFLLWLIGKFEYTIVDNLRIDAYSVGELFVNAIGIVCQQGSEMPAFGISIRIIFLMLMVAVIFIYTAYSAYIVVLLQSPGTSIQTLNDLLDSRFELGVHNMPNQRLYFENIDEPIRRAIYERKVAPKGKKPNWLNLTEGLVKMRQGLFAFHAEISPVYQEMQENWNEYEKCGIQEIQYFTRSSIGFGIPKDSPYKEVLRVAYRIIMESGLKSQVFNGYYTKKPPCLGSGSNFISVGMVDVYPAIMILAYGYVITSICFLLEFTYFKANKKLFFLNNKLIKKIK